MARSSKSEKPITEENKIYEPVVSPKIMFAEKYRKAGYNTGVTDGVLMFYGPYDMQNITEMLRKDGYAGSFGVAEKVQKRMAEYAEG